MILCSVLVMWYSSEGSALIHKLSPLVCEISVSGQPILHMTCMHKVANCARIRNADIDRS